MNEDAGCAFVFKNTLAPSWSLDLNQWNALLLLIIVELDLFISSYRLVLEVLLLPRLCYFLVHLILEGCIAQDSNSAFSFLHAGIINRLAIDQLQLDKIEFFLLLILFFWL
jgi:hypothetical protein